MDVTSQELVLAKAVKSAANTDPMIVDSRISDFEFLRHGMTAKSNGSKALVRIRKL